MESNNPQPSGSSLPSKPWEQAGVQSAAGPFRPSSPGSTNDVVEASGTAKPGEIVTANNNGPANLNSLVRSVPSRPWEQNYGNNLGGFNSGINNNTSYGTGLYGSGGGYGGSYGGGLYGNNMYRGYGGGLYGGSGYGGMNGGYGGPMGSYGMGMGMGIGGPYGDPDPNGPFGGPMSPPGFWISFLRVMQGVVTFFGRISMLVDQNTQAFHMFMSALLQLFDRTGMLYGELARFVLRLLGIKTKAKKIHPQEHGALPGAHHGQNYIEEPLLNETSPSVVSIKDPEVPGVAKNNSNKRENNDDTVKVEGTGSGFL